MKSLENVLFYDSYKQFYVNYGKPLDASDPTRYLISIVYSKTVIYIMFVIVLVKNKGKTTE